MLQWLAQLPRTWTAFVANRASEVQQILSRANWNHVSPSSNPADCSSRGARLEVLQSFRLWWNGPEWLQKSQDSWSKSKLHLGEPIEVRVKNAKITASSISLAVTQSTLIFRHDRYSSFSKLILVVATVFIAMEKLKRVNRSPDVTAADITSAKRKTLKEHQIDYYATEYHTLEAGKKLSKHRRILNLNSFFDDESKIRFGGRLSQGQFRELKKFLLLVCQVSKLAFNIFMKLRFIVGRS